MIKKLKAYYRRQEFYPGFLGLVTNPFFIARRGLAKNISLLAPELGGRIIDVGCGSKPYREMFQCAEYIGVDIENPGHDHSREDIDVYYDGKVLPFETDSFDCVITNQVLEHVFTPQQFLKELNRVLRPGGKLLLTVPFAWDEHEQPNDYARYSSFGLQHLLRDNGFEITSHVKSVNDVGAIFQLAALYLFKKLSGKNAWVNRLVTFVFIAPLNFSGFLLAAILPKNDDLYLDNIVLAQKKMIE